MNGTFDARRLERRSRFGFVIKGLGRVEEFFVSQMKEHVLLRDSDVMSVVPEGPLADGDGPGRRRRSLREVRSWRRAVDEGGAPREEVARRVSWPAAPHAPKAGLELPVRVDQPESRGTRRRRASPQTASDAGKVVDASSSCFVRCRCGRSRLAKQSSFDAYVASVSEVRLSEAPRVVIELTSKRLLWKVSKGTARELTVMPRPAPRASRCPLGPHRCTSLAQLGGPRS